jgi:FkbM family methyltransferase
MGIRRIIRTHLVDKLPVDSRLFIERVYFYHYIKNDIKVFKQLSNPQKVCLDIGANIGNLTLFFCKFFSHVYCFEPITSLCELLERRFQGCNVSVENCALGRNRSESYLHIPIVRNKRIETRSSLIVDFQDKSIWGEKVNDVAKIKVLVQKLDDFKIDNIGLIKIDVEGFEMEVLEGAYETITRNLPNIFIEIEQRYHREASIYDIFQRIKDIGYFGYFFYKNRLRLIQDFDLDHMQNESNEGSSDYVSNFIFTSSSILNLKL